MTNSRRTYNWCQGPVAGRGPEVEKHCSMEHNPSWEADSFSASQEIPRILWNPKVHYRVYKCPPPVRILSQINPIHIPIPLPEDPSKYYPPIYTWVFQWSLSLRIPHQNTLCISCLPHSWYMPLPSHSSRFPHPNNIWWGVQIVQPIIYIVFSIPLLPRPS